DIPERFENMAGHNKWSKIKRKKAANDSKKGANFSKLSREIQVATREGGPDPEANIRLRLAVDRAKRDGMPNDTIERAIARASGATSDADSFETVFYEGYGPGGFAVMAVALTDNRNRTAAEVRNAFSRNGGSLGETGSVAWQFDTVGQIVIPANGNDPDEIALMAIDAGATDVETDDEEIVVTTDPTDLTGVAEALRELDIEISDMTITRLPQTPMDLDPAKAASAMRMLEALEDLDDVNEVYTNANFAEEAVTV
ncbi:MAG: YebC/PmpR family DNA-binding transcriptional regulator, partial [Chloroflexota bacterium]